MGRIPLKITPHIYSLAFVCFLSNWHEGYMHRFTGLKIAWTQKGRNLPFQSKLYSISRDTNPVDYASVAETQIRGFGISLSQV